MCSLAGARRTKFFQQGQAVPPRVNGAPHLRQRRKKRSRASVHWRSASVFRVRRCLASKHGERIRRSNYFRAAARALVSERNLEAGTSKEGGRFSPERCCFESSEFDLLVFPPLSPNLLYQ